MENQTKIVAVTPEEPQEQTQAGVSRRRLLKALAVSGGAVAGLTMLPGKWTRPVVEAGELAAHAETSPQGGIELYDFELTCDLREQAGAAASGEYRGTATFKVHSTMSMAGAQVVAYFYPNDICPPIGGGVLCAISNLKILGSDGSFDWTTDTATDLPGAQVLGAGAMRMKLVVDGVESNTECSDEDICLPEDID